MALKIFKKESSVSASQENMDSKFPNEQAPW